MKLLIITLCLVSLALEISGKKPCPHQPSQTCMERGDDFIYTNAKVYTVDPANDPDWHKNPKEAVVVLGGKIVFVGSNEQAETYKTPDVTILDLQGLTILPGFHDVSCL